MSLPTDHSSTAIGGGCHLGKYAQKLTDDWMLFQPLGANHYITFCDTASY